VDAKREKLPYEIDGVVIKVNSTAIQNELGYTQKRRAGPLRSNIRRGRRPTGCQRHHRASGAHGDADAGGAARTVQVGGVTVSRSTLHNMDEIERLGLQIGDTVLIERAGEVIPHVLKSDEAGKKSGKPFKMPKNCPECG